MSKRNNVYLVPLANGTYVPYVQETAPTKNAVRLTREGKYPVRLEYIVYFNSKNGCEIQDKQIQKGWENDFGDSRLVFECEISNRKELIEKLLECGQNCRVIFYLWEFYGFNVTIRSDILFNNAYWAKKLMCYWREDEDSERVVDDVLSLREFYRYARIIRDVSTHSKEIQDKIKDVPKERFYFQCVETLPKRK